jgi:hypothetical protein
MKEIKPLEFVKPKEHELVPVLLINGTLNNGRDFDFAVREDRGDTLTETPETLTFRSGTTGQEVTIQRSQIAVLSRVTRMVAREYHGDWLGTDLHKLP